MGDKEWADNLAKPLKGWKERHGNSSAQWQIHMVAGNRTAPKFLQFVFESLIKKNKKNWVKSLPY